METTYNMSKSSTNQPANLHTTPTTDEHGVQVFRNITAAIHAGAAFENIELTGIVVNNLLTKLTNGAEQDLPQLGGINLSLDFLTRLYEDNEIYLEGRPPTPSPTSSTLARTSSTPAPRTSSLAPRTITFTPVRLHLQSPPA